VAGGKERTTSRLAEPTPPRIDDLKTGSETAWSAAVHLLGPPLRGFIGLRGASDPDGVLGDVFLDLARSIDRLEGDWASFRAMAFVIARRRVIDGFRSAARRPTESVDTATLDNTVAGDVEEEVMDRLERRWVVELLEVITPIQRDVLTLRFVSGLSVREVAEVMGTTESAVKANQRRALAAVRRQLAAGGPRSADVRAVREMAETLGGQS
jgi:RNA polymerase sigma-70 factor (ECF subfamily)